MKTDRNVAVQLAAQVYKYNVPNLREHSVMVLIKLNNFPHNYLLLWIGQPSDALKNCIAADHQENCLIANLEQGSQLMQSVNEVVSE